MCLVNIDKGGERKKAKYGDFLLISQETHRNHKTCLVQCSHRQQLPAEPCAPGTHGAAPGHSSHRSPTANPPFHFQTGFAFTVYLTQTGTRKAGTATHPCTPAQGHRTASRFGWKRPVSCTWVFPSSPGALSQIHTCKLHLLSVRFSSG